MRRNIFPLAAFGTISTNVAHPFDAHVWTGPLLEPVPTMLSASDFGAGYVQGSSPEVHNHASSASVVSNSRQSHDVNITNVTFDLRSGGASADMTTAPDPSDGAAVAQQGRRRRWASHAPISV